MDDQTVIDIGTKAAWVAMKVSAPVLISALVIGILISIFQAATQINEQTLTFVPKIMIITVAMVLCGPWILQEMLTFTVDIFNSISGVMH